MVTRFKITILSNIFSECDLQVFFNGNIQQGIEEKGKKKYDYTTDEKEVEIHILKKDDWCCQTICKKIYKCITSADLVFGNVLDGNNLPVEIDFKTVLADRDCDKEVKLDEIIHVNINSFKFWKKCMFLQLAIGIILLNPILAVIGCAVKQPFIFIFMIPMDVILTFLLSRKSREVIRLLEKYI